MLLLVNPESLTLLITSKVTKLMPGSVMLGPVLVGVVQGLYDGVAEDIEREIG